MSVALCVESVSEACGCREWADKIVAHGAYDDVRGVIAEARRVWWNELPLSAWLEAFASHPRLGDSVPGSGPSAREQEHLQDQETRRALGAWNARYESRFGFVFLLKASGSTPAHVLRAIQTRCSNSVSDEVCNAAIEHMKIVEFRLERMLPPPPAARRTGALAAHMLPAHATRTRSPITTHVLDISVGRPAPGVAVALRRRVPEAAAAAWECLAVGETDKDGRIQDLLPPTHELEPGSYALRFDMSAYHAAQRADLGPPFYPHPEVAFTVGPDERTSHYHIPLTYAPFGYSTYRGS